MCSGFALVALLAFGGSANGAVVVTFQEIGGDVLATGGGSVITAGLTLRGNGQINDLVTPSTGFFILGANGGIYNVWQTVSGPGSFGTGAQTNALAGIGDRFGLAAGQFLVLPQAYVSGAALNANATWSNATFSSLGLTPGTYVWTWGTGGNADSLTVSVTTPEPAAILLAGAGLILLLLAKR